MFSGVVGCVVKDARYHEHKIQLTLCTASDFCKNDSLTVLFGSNDSSYTISMWSDVHINTHIMVGQKKKGLGKQ